MSERNAFILFFIGIVVLTMVWMFGLNALGADDETLVAAAMLLLPIVGLGGGFLFMRYH
jgi:lipopolysaccharide export LptBFGC system permease protein LptF